MLTASQLIAQAAADANNPFFATTAGQIKLQVILDELCQNHDFALARTVYYFTLNPSLITTISGFTNFGGPYPLPADYLRTSETSGTEGVQFSFFFVFNGVPYPLMPWDLGRMDMQVQQPGIQNLPRAYTTDMSVTPPNAYVYPGPSGAFPCTLRYQRLMPPIVDFTNTVPWFPDQAYLIERLTGDLCASTQDTRRGDFLAHAKMMLGEYETFADDKTNRAQTMIMDRRRYGRSASWNKLRNSKTIGW